MQQRDGANYARALLLYFNGKSVCVLEKWRRDWVEAVFTRQLNVRDMFYIYVIMGRGKCKLD